MKKREVSLDYIRVFATIMIVVFHFASTFIEGESVLIKTANITWGGLGTALFFLLSGYLLRKRHYNITSVKDFYISRWLSIFPPFYIAFIVAYLINVVRLKQFFYQAPAYTLIYTLLGIDNLIKWFGVTSYAIVGEWFTGIIVILYLLFPILNIVMKRTRWSTTIIILIMYVLDIMLGWYPVLPDISIIACLFIFWMGMLLADKGTLFKKKEINYAFGAIYLAAFLILLFVAIPVPQIIVTHIEAILLFMSMNILLAGTKTESWLSKTISYLSTLSYAVYLVHHYILFVLDASRKYVGIINVMPVPVIFMLYIVIVSGSSFALWKISSKVVMLIQKVF